MIENNNLLVYIGKKIKLYRKLKGMNAAKFVKGEMKRSDKPIDMIATEGVRYTVPKTVYADNIKDKLEVRFRVGDVFKNKYISVYFDGSREL